MAVGQKPVPLVNIKIGGTDVHPPQNGAIGSAPWPYGFPKRSTPPFWGDNFNPTFWVRVWLQKETASPELHGGGGRGVFFKGFCQRGCGFPFGFTLNQPQKGEKGNHQKHKPKLLFGGLQCCGNTNQHASWRYGPKCNTEKRLLVTCPRLDASDIC